MVKAAGGTVEFISDAQPRDQQRRTFRRAAQRRFVAQAVTNSETFEWSQVAVSSYFQMESDSAQQPLLSLTNGDPILIQKNVGQGRVLCLTTSLDRAWTTFPTKPVFAPLMRELISTLADPLRRQTSFQLFVGDAVRLPVAKTIRSATITAPDGVVTAARVNDEGILEWNAVTKPGVYRVKSQTSNDAFSFAVNIPDLEHEGDLSRVSESDLKNILPGASLETVFGKSAHPEGVARRAARTRLDRYFFGIGGS